MSTLRFGAAAKTVVNHVVVNHVKRSQHEWQRMLDQANRKARRLEYELMKAREEAAMYSGLAGVEAPLCPLTEAPFADPVVAADGYTYEAAALISHIRRNVGAAMTPG